jgi:glycogen operon protein
VNIKVLPGKPSPLGASWDGLGVNFALFAENATAVELCLFDPDDPTVETARVRLTEVTAHVWHGYLPRIRPGQLYGYRVHGPFDPARGLRFDPGKLLIDPYAKAIAGKVDWRAPVFAYPVEEGGDERDLTADERDDAWGMPKGVVIDPTFDWDGDHPPRTPWHETVIYEVHVKGFTASHPEVPEDQRGTYAALASRPMLEYLRDLGVTAVELLPVHDILDEKNLLDRGSRNYWGYNNNNYFSPDARYSSAGDRGGQVAEFKAMVRELHRAGIEVILDVVYNHTSEGNHFGPTLFFRGIDNQAYYRLAPDQPRFYTDFSGTGNSLNMLHPQVIKLIMDSLRYWVLEMHVDGFRFDLASTLARELHEVERLSAFFDTIHQDPVLSGVKLIAEPWDLGEGGYQVGNFPILWAEWNGKYRDTVRAYWRGDAGQMRELGFRFTGSSDLYEDDGRAPFASINFVTAHDGFTLRDLVSYEHKHNEANGEENRDGADDNLSCNYGVEGPTDDPEIRAVRARQRRNFLATLLLSQGVPMICGGDEIGRTQQGNNNAYCQDNEISWYDWELDEDGRELLEFARRAIRLRAKHPVFRRRRFFKGRQIHGSECRDISWFGPDSGPMTDEEWGAGWARALAVRLGGDAIDEADPRTGEPVRDATMTVLLNAGPEPITFTVTPLDPATEWEVILDTNYPRGDPGRARVPDGGNYPLGARSLALLCQRAIARATREP